MFATPAFAQTATPAAGGDSMSMLIQLAPILGIFVLMYFLMIRPQQRRMKQHQEMVSQLKRGDVVVLSSGVIGKVTKVDDAEVALDIATGVNVKVVRQMISEVRTRSEPAPANDSKAGG
jgi:preprotein translocase subunit YajC